MTLIVCLKAQGCIVIAADSLTTSASGKVFKSTTKKIHMIESNAATVGCGLARVKGVYWGDVFKKYTKAPAGTNFTGLTTHLKSFLTSIIQTVPRNNVGACAGGNTFLLAGYDPYSAGMIISEITRHNDNRIFDSFTPIVSCSLAQNYISWHGDTESVGMHIALRTMRYSDKMFTYQAMEFAIDAIRDGIKAHKKLMAKTTIGGEHISVCVVSAKCIASFNVSYRD